MSDTILATYDGKLDITTINIGDDVEILSFFKRYRFIGGMKPMSKEETDERDNFIKSLDGQRIIVRYIDKSRLSQLPIVRIDVRDIKLRNILWQ